MSSDNKPVLSSFNTRGRAEIIRLTLAEANVDYIDNRVSEEEWIRIKEDPKFTFGQMPQYDNGKGNSFVQTLAILRYIAKQYGLMGTNDVESAKVDMTVDGYFDFRTRYKDAMAASDQALLRYFVCETAPRWVNYFGQILAKNGTGFAVGNQFTIADIAMYLATEEMLHIIQYSPNPNLFVDNAEMSKILLKHHADVISRPRIASWLARRPVTER